MRASYRQILKTTSLVGSTQLINILLGMVRGKLMAVLVGAAGVGLAGMFQSAVGLIEVVAGLGLRQAGVRGVAVASKDGHEHGLSASRVLLRTAMVGALVGSLLTVVFRRALAISTFGDDGYAWAIGVMAIPVFCGCMAASFGACLQGLRRIRLLAASSVLSTLFASLAGLAVVWRFGRNGIVPMLVLGAITGLLVMWFFACRAGVRLTGGGWGGWYVQTRDTVKLGVAMMLAALAGTGGTYLANVFVRQQFGIAGVGLYLAGWTLAGTYVRMILAAMGSDFYPRLSGLVASRKDVNRVVNEQMQLGLLLALPGVLFTLTFAPWILRVLTSADFVSAAPLTRWLVVSAIVQMLSWPMSYILLAYARSRLYMVTEFAGHGIRVALLWVGLRAWGLVGAGIGYVVFQLVFALFMRLVASRVSGFRFTARTLSIAALSALPVLVMQVLLVLLSQRTGVFMVSGLLVTVLTSIGCLVVIKQLTGLGFNDIRHRFLTKGPSA